MMTITHHDLLILAFGASIGFAAGVVMVLIVVMVYIIRSDEVDERVPSEPEPTTLGELSDLERRQQADRERRLGNMLGGFWAVVLMGLLIWFIRAATEWVLSFPAT